MPSQKKSEVLRPDYQPTNNADPDPDPNSSINWDFKWKFHHWMIMILISWGFTVVSLALASLIYYYVSIKGKAGDWGDGFENAYFQLALRSLHSLGVTTGNVGYLANAIH